MEEKFNCRKCKIEIGGHNQYLHDGMCDDCYFGEYFPEEAQIFETDKEQIERLCSNNRRDNNIFLKYLLSGGLEIERFEKIIKEINSKITCSSKACCEFLNNLNKDNIE